MYADFNFKTKKALKMSIKIGQVIRVYEPGREYLPIEDGVHSIEGPHYPKPHTWYATVEVVNKKIVKVIN